MPRWFYHAATTLALGASLPALAMQALPAFTVLACSSLTEPPPAEPVTVETAPVNPDAGVSSPDTFREEGLYAFRFDLDPYFSSNSESWRRVLINSSKRFLPNIAVHSF